MPTEYNRKPDAPLCARAAEANGSVRAAFGAF